MGLFFFLVSWLVGWFIEPIISLMIDGFLFFLAVCQLVGWLFVNESMGLSIDGMLCWLVG